jgi:hypothetical protein
MSARTGRPIGTMVSSVQAGLSRLLRMTCAGKEENRPGCPERLILFLRSSNGNPELSAVGRAC